MKDHNYHVSDPRDQVSGKSFTLGDLFSAIGRYWFLVLLLTAAGGAGGYWLAKGLPDRYASEVTLISDSERSGMVDTGGAGTVAIVDPSATTTVVETIGSTVVLERAMATLSPETLARLTAAAGLGPEFADATPEQKHAAIRRYLSRNLDVTNSGRSYVIRVSYRSPDPVLSADAANAIANSYLAYRSELKRDVYEDVLNDLGEELASLKAELQAADHIAQSMREEARLVAKRFDALTGLQQESAIGQTAPLFARQREAEREADATAAVYERLLLKQRDIMSRMEGREINVQLFSSAVVPTRPSGFNAKPAVLGLGILGGFFVGASLAVMFNVMFNAARRSRSRKETML